MQSDNIQILRKSTEKLSAALVDQLDSTFFEASGRSDASFATPQERATFRERWLGRYLAGGTDPLFIAMRHPETLAGYLVGALENPSEQARFDDIGYFRSDFADLCRRFPAHLHINLAPAYRGQGIGARLIEAFAAHARAAGVVGMHAVTGKSMRNVGFYRACGFTEQGSAAWNGREIVFLGRSLHP